jgi:hypothetical protein
MKRADTPKRRIAAVVQLSAKFYINFLCVLGGLCVFALKGF